ncbi:MAG TPA: hypothetical protein VF507_08815, partial [Pyrinomonadaceae bacterium]
MSFQYRFEALDEDEWPRGEFTPADKRVSARFDSAWRQTLELLEKETRLIHARPGSVVIGTFHRRYDVLRSGQLRPETKMPDNPGVVVKFEVYDKEQKRYVPASFECDQFLQWKDNVRAVALALEALRLVDRYKVGRVGAQYVGYKALPPAPLTLSGMTPEAAAEELAKIAPWSAQEILSDADV